MKGIGIFVLVAIAWWLAFSLDHDSPPPKEYDLDNLKIEEDNENP